MINQLIRFYNQNRKTIIVVIIFVAFFLILFRALVYFNRESKEREYGIINAQYSNNSTVNNVNNSDSSLLHSNETVNNNIQNSNTNTLPKSIISKFINFCNNGNVQDAYYLITNDCKQAIFPNINTFINNYYKKIFTQNKTFKIEESMYEGVYQVTYYDNVLSNGGYTTNQPQTDYIFYTKEDGQDKISLNQFLYKKEIQKEVTKDNISVKVVAKQVYVDYEIYEIQFINNSGKTIMIDTKQNNESMSLLDNNNLKYYSNISQFDNERLLIKDNFATTLNITFYKIYNNERIIKEIQFLDIIKNYDDYINGKEKNTVQINVALI